VLQPQEVGLNLLHGQHAAAAVHGVTLQERYASNAHGREQQHGATASCSRTATSITVAADGQLLWFRRNLCWLQHC
jgi:hypothetical protein